MEFIASMGRQVSAVPTGIINTDGLRGELMALLGIAIVGIALMALLSFGGKKSGMRDVLQVAGAVLIVLMIVGMAGLVGTDAGRTLVSTLFNLG